MPEFDPLDGGIDARALFLFEKPGPMTAGVGRGNRPGSGFISRNNNDATAEATFKFMQQAGFAPNQIIIWNVVPWWDGSRRVPPQQLADGIKCIGELIALLPRQRAVVLVGKKAAKAESRIIEMGKFAVFTSDHPSPIVRARWPERWKAIPSVWTRAREHVDTAEH